MTNDSESSLEQIEAEVRNVTAEQHQEEAGLVDDLLTCCLRGFTRLRSFTLADDNRLQFAHLLLATRSFSSVRCSYTLLQQGYYTQALTLIRSAMEDNLTALDCEKFEATVAALLNGQGELGKGKLTYTEMAKRQGSGFYQAWSSNYGVVSEYAAHARRNSLKILVDPTTGDLQLGGRYNKDLFVGACDALLAAASGTADLVARVLGEDAVPWQKETYPKLKAANEWREKIRDEIETGGKI